MCGYFFPRRSTLSPVGVSFRNVSLHGELTLGGVLADLAQHHVRSALFYVGRDLCAQRRPASQSTELGELVREAFEVRTLPAFCAKERTSCLEQFRVRVVFF